MLRACHLWSLLEKQGKQELCLRLLSAGFPSTPLTELLMESENKQFVETTELIETTAPDRFLVIQPGPQRLIHIFKKLQNKTDDESTSEALALSNGTPQANASCANAFILCLNWQ